MRGRLLPVGAGRPGRTRLGKFDLGVAIIDTLKRQDSIRLFPADVCVDIDSSLVENAIRSPAMNRRSAVFPATTKAAGTGPASPA